MKKIVATVLCREYDIESEVYFDAKVSKVFDKTAPIQELRKWIKSKVSNKDIQDAEYSYLDEDEEITPFEGEPFID